MRDIYQQAEQVLVYLSTPEGSFTGMCWLCKLVREVPARDPVVNQRDWVWRLTAPRTSICHRDRLLEHLRKNITKDDFTQGWLAHYAILQSPWWERAWVFQEFIVAAKVDVLCCRQSISWEALWLILRSLFDIQRSDLSDSSHFSNFLRQSGVTFEIDMPKELHGISRCLDSGKVLDALRRVQFMGHSRDQRRYQLDLKDFLQHSRCCRTSDARDKVYAFLGLAHSGYQIQPDYSRSLTEVLIETTQRIIAFENSLDVLIHARSTYTSQHPFLPSWVADWTQQELWQQHNTGRGSLINELHSGRNSQMLFGASFSNITKGEHEHLCLEVSGILLDEINEDMHRRLCRMASLITAHFSIPFANVLRPRDEIWSLAGARFLVVLRVEAEGYRLISTFYAQEDRWSVEKMGGIVRGEARRLQRIRII